MRGKTIRILAIAIVVLFCLMQMETVQAQEKLNVHIEPPALIVCHPTDVRITITDINNKLVKNATIFIDGQELNSGNGIITISYHAQESQIPAGIQVRVEKDGYYAYTGKINVFKEKCEDYNSIMAAGALILQIISAAKSGGGKVPFSPSQAQIMSWSGNIRLPSGSIVSETATSIEGEVYAKAIDPEQTWIIVNFTQLKVTFASSIWDGHPTGTSIATLDVTYASDGFMDTSSGELWMSFQTKLTNDILKVPAIEIGWFDGTFDNATGELALYGSSGLIRWPNIGGFAVPVDKFGLLAPYVGVGSTITVGAVAAAIYVKRVKRRKEKQ